MEPPRNKRKVLLIATTKAPTSRATPGGKGAIAKPRKTTANNNTQLQLAPRLVGRAYENFAIVYFYLIDLSVPFFAAIAFSCFEIEPVAVIGTLYTDAV